MMDGYLFDGDTYDPLQDMERLSTQQGRVYRAMRNGAWWTLAALAKMARGSEAGVSARVRDLRKERWGSLRVDNRRVEGENGLWEYRLVL